METRRRRCFWIMCVFVNGFLASSALKLSHENVVKHPGDTFLVTCNDDAGRQVVWTGPKGALSSKTNPRVEAASYGTSLTFNKVTLKEGGNYTCTAGEDQKKLKLIVEAPLRFVDTAANQFAKENSDTTLRCEVTGGDSKGNRPIITWSSEKSDLKPKKYEVIGDGLLIRNVTRENSGVYTCTAMQPSTGDLIEQKIQLRVQHKPTSSHWAKDEAAWGYLGGEVNLTCEVIAEPPATFQWFWQKKLMHGGLVHNTTNKSVRQIQLTDAKMFGNYMCQAKNAIGTLDKLFILQQGVRPESPDFIELRGKNSDLLDIGVQRKEKEKVPADMKPLGYGVQYRPIGEQQWNFHYFTLNKDNSYPLRDLKHGTAYEVRVATKNLAGYSVYTNASVFETLHSQTSASETTSSSYLICIGVAALLSW